MTNNPIRNYRLNPDLRITTNTVSVVICPDDRYVGINPGVFVYPDRYWSLVNGQRLLLQIRVLARNVILLRYGKQGSNNPVKRQAGGKL